VAAAILLAGAILPIGENLYPEIYPPEAPPAWVEAVGLGESIEDTGYVLVHGRTLFPRYYLPGEGEAGSTYRTLYPLDSDRVTLFIAGPTSSGVRLVVDELPEFEIPFGADVLAVGCYVQLNKDPYVEAAALYFPESGVLLERGETVDQLTCRRP
jgi:hypothetical protein